MELAMNFTSISFVTGAVVVALAGTSAASYSQGKAKVQAQFDAYRAGVALAAQQSEALERTKEQKWQDAQQKVIQNATQEINSARAHAVTADRAAAGLRKRINALASAHKSGGRSSITGASASQQGIATFDLLTGVLERVERDGRSIAAYADQLRIAGAACERSYDALRQEIQ
jgi:hypothetical protein